MRTLYSLRIETPWPSAVSRVLGLFPPEVQERGWVYEIEDGDSDEPVDFIREFVSALEGKYDALQAVGVERGDISVWVLYEYEGQCNLEFAPTELLALAKEGITLCVSCWEVASC